MDIGRQINDLVKNTGKSAPQITHALKFVGDGSMQVGIKRISEYIAKEAERSGTIKGITGGIIITAIVSAIIVYIRDMIKKIKLLNLKEWHFWKNYKKDLPKARNCQPFRLTVALYKNQTRETIYNQTSGVS